MANKKHLKILKKGVRVWNEWRHSHPEIKPDLCSTDLRTVDLCFANLKGAFLSAVSLRGVNLRNANLIKADLRNADLSETDLSDTVFHHADLRATNFSFAVIHNADLRSANLEKAVLFYTTIASVDLSLVKGLEKVKHEGPSDISQYTFRKSNGRIPKIFLQGCGLNKWEIAASKLYNPDLTSSQITDLVYQIDELKNTNPIQMHNLFISYNHNDGAFVDALETLLREKDISFWRDVDHPSSGKLEKVIDRAMRLNQVVVIVLSQHSIASDWVQFEVRKARKIEIEEGRDVMLPIALDDSWKEARWPDRLKEQIMEYSVMDFSEWKDEAILKQQFENMVKGLNLFYRKEG